MPKQIKLFPFNQIADYPGSEASANIAVYDNGHVQINMAAGPLKFSNSFTPAEVRAIVAVLTKAIDLAGKARRAAGES